jgi:hypothetical protein
MYFFFVVFPKQYTRPTVIWQIITHDYYITYSLLTLLVLKKGEKSMEKSGFKPTMKNKTNESK